MRKIIVCFVILLAATLASSGAPPDRLPNLVAPAEARGLMMVGGGVPVAAAPVTYWVTQLTTGNVGSYNAGVLYGPVTISAAGSAKKMQVMVALYNSAETWTLGLYDGSKNKLGSCDITIDGTGAKECSFASPITISSTGTYYVAWITTGDNGSNEIESDTSTSGTFDYVVANSGLPASLATDDTYRLCYMGVYLE